MLLRGWMQPVPVAMPLAVAPAVSEYVYEPYGVCLVMGAFNYPIQLTVSRLTGKYLRPRVLTAHFL